MNDKKTLNFPIIAAYTVLAAGLAVVTEFFLSGTATPEGLVKIGQSLAETGFSVAVIAVSILAVITNISDKQFFGIKAGEYLKFRRKKLAPGFYDVLVVIVLLGALQYAALALSAGYAAAVVFAEIIVLMITQIRWGLGIAFFYYNKEKEIRRFLLGEIEVNLRIVADEKAHKKRRERAQTAVLLRIDNLFAHTKSTVTLKETTRVSNNLSLIAYIFERLLGNEYQSVWHNYETRVDSLLASIISDDELNEYVVSALVKMTDSILDTRESDNKLIAMNCDFDRTRNEAYKMLDNAHVKLLQNMFDKNLFYRLAAVKIYGIRDTGRKAARYSVYTEQFAKSAAASGNNGEIEDMLLGILKKLAPGCFVDGKADETAIYFLALLKSLKQNKISTNGIWGELEEKQEQSEEYKRSICMLEKAAGVKTSCKLSEMDSKEVEEFVKSLQISE